MPTPDMPRPDMPRPDIRSGNGSPPGPARYDVRHATAYTYSESVPICHNEIRLVPRNLPTQRLLSSCISVVPQFDYDPAATTTSTAGTLHVTVAWGRDYGDVSPVKGVCVGGGSHGIEGAVHVSRIA